jgi:hypothetical protein
MNCSELSIIMLAVIATLLSFFEFSVGVSEAVFVSQYSALDNGCHHIWGWIVAASVFDICIPVFSCCGLATLFRAADGRKPDEDHQIIQYLKIGQLIIAIWSVVTYYHITTSCYNFWQSNAPELWIFVMIHFAMLWISIGIIIVLILSALVACVIHIQSSDLQTRRVSDVRATIARCNQPVPVNDMAPNNMV